MSTQVTTEGIGKTPNRRLSFWVSVLSAMFSIIGIQSVDAQDQTSLRPNVLFIAMDDLNDWIGCMGGHPQAKTPNLDRLAKSGILFTNAHCAAPACNPSRTAIFTGMAPNVSGVYTNSQQLREVLPDAELLLRGAYFGTVHEIKVSWSSCRE